MSSQNTGLLLSHFVRKKLLLLLSMIILIIGFTCPPNIHFKFITSLRQVLLQSATILLQIATGITIKVRQNIFQGLNFFFNNNCNILVKKM